MNLTSTPVHQRPPRSLGPAPAAVAILYPKVGNVLRVPLRRTRTGGRAGCEQHPERQFIVWFNRMAAARPGFPMQIKSILLITGQPLCPSCHRALATYLSRYYLADKLRLRTTGAAPCRCGGDCGCSRRGAGPGSVLAAPVLLDALLRGLSTGTASGFAELRMVPLLDELLGEGPPVTPPPVNKHKSPAFRKASADLKRDSIDDPDLPKADRGWLKQERNQRGNNPRKWRNPPGKDVGHLDPNDNTRVRWEGSSENRSRGARFKREINSFWG